MKINEIPAGEKVFIDANIFIYHFTGVSEQCSQFLIRCEKNEINAVTSVNVLLEVLHRLMMVEAVKKNLVTPPNVRKKLENNPSIVTQLSDYFLNTQKIPMMGIEIVEVDFQTFLKSQNFRNTYGLMVNDSIILASMQKEGIHSLVTNDEGFNIVEDIFVFNPDDLEI